MPTDYSQFTTDELLAMKDRINKKKSVSKRGEYQFGSQEEVAKGLENTKNLNLGTVDALENMGRSSYATVTGAEYNPSKRGEGGYYSAGQFIGETLPFLAMGPQGLLGRTATSLGAGALFSGGDVEEGVNDAAIASIVGESIPLVGKAIKGGADKFFRSEYSKELMAQLKSKYDSSQNEALGFLNSVMGKHGEEKLYPAQKKEITQSFYDSEQRLSPDVKMKFKEYIKSPTINSSQDFQRQARESVQNLDMSQVKNRDRFTATEDFRKSILNSMYGRLDQLDPNAKSAHQDFRKIWAKDVEPLQSTKTMKKIASQGAEADLSPDQLNKGLKLAKEKNPNNEVLKQSSDELSGKLKRSDAYSKVGTTTADLGAALLGFQMMGAPGLLAGAAAHYAKPVFSNVGQLALNEELSKFLAKNYPKVRSIGISQTVAPENE